MGGGEETVDTFPLKKLINIYEESLLIIKDQNETIKNLIQQNSKIIKIYTSKNTLHCEENWFIPIGKYKDPCLVCKYYGHGGNYCPNIQESYLGACYKCWNTDHEAKNCSQRSREPPFKSNYITPEKLIKKIGKGEF